MARLNLRARMPLCGLISSYNDDEPPPGPRSFGNLLRMRRETIQQSRQSGILFVHPAAAVLLHPLGAATAAPYDHRHAGRDCLEHRKRTDFRPPGRHDGRGHPAQRSQLLALVSAHGLLNVFLDSGFQRHEGQRGALP